MHWPPSALFSTVTSTIVACTQPPLPYRQPRPPRWLFPTHLSSPSLNMLSQIQILDQERTTWKFKQLYNTNQQNKLTRIQQIKEYKVGTYIYIYKPPCYWFGSFWGHKLLPKHKTPTQKHKKKNSNKIYKLPLIVVTDPPDADSIGGDPPALGEKHHRCRHCYRERISDLKK